MLLSFMDDGGPCDHWDLQCNIIQSWRSTDKSLSSQLNLSSEICRQLRDLILESCLSKPCPVNSIPLNGCDIWTLLSQLGSAAGLFLLKGNFSLPTVAKMLAHVFLCMHYCRVYLTISSALNQLLL